MSGAAMDEPVTPPPGYFAGFPFDSAPLAIAPIQTERLILRPLAESDIDDIWQYQRLDEVLRYIPWPKRDFEAAAAHTRWRAAAHSLDADGRAIFLACVLAPSPDAGEHAGRVIGDVMLRLSSVETAELEIGWVFHPDFHGRGYATEAAAAMQRLAFDGIGAHRLVAHLDPRNEASARVCAKLGLAHEGTLRESYYDKGEWSDAGLYAMIARDWRALEDTPAPHTP
ncbi:GNAT family N-acetyltransferase [Microterricola pindariensis]|uniref:GNAT family N-acetyltransferase n=1 Tax=Microterricola pindariensis TaxID=478010 RepID=UPI001374E434|nr:GNAT family protein [Microterricola pindariensis]